MSVQPSPEGDGLPLDKQLEALGKEFGFFLEESKGSMDHPAHDDEKTIRVMVISHKKDAAQWQRLYRHLGLLEISGWRIEWSPVVLSSSAVQDLFVDRFRARLITSHLVLLAMSIDLVEALVKQSPATYKALAELDEETVVWPVLLRPVFWSCSFPTLEPIPGRAISLWGNQDAAHVTVAKKFFGILEGIKTFLEEDEGSESR